jgi:hypothetical protein
MAAARVQRDQTIRIRQILRGRPRLYNHSIAIAQEARPTRGGSPIAVVGLLAVRRDD